MNEEHKKNNNWLKVIGWIIAGIFAVTGWIYAGIMSGYTARIVRLEAETAILKSNDQVVLVQQARFEEMFKGINEKLDALIRQHRSDK